jgi:hypothetical protein
MPEKTNKELREWMRNMPLKERFAFYWRVTKKLFRTQGGAMAKDLAHDVSHRAPVSGRALCHWCRAPIKYGATACRKCGRDQGEWIDHTKR